MENRVNGSTMDAPKEIKCAREQINQLDDSIVRLLTQRFQTAALIGQIKKQDDLQVLDRNREAEVLNRVRTVSPDSQTTDYVAAVYEAILKNSRDYQHHLIEGN